MIAKISSTENLGGALGYNFKKVEKGEASILLAAELYQNKEGRYTMEEVFADMEALIPKKCRTKKTVFHCSLNPHPDEKLSDELLVQIAKEYMEALGYGKQPYIISCSSTMISPVSIYTSCRFEWIVIEEKSMTASRSERASRLPTPWRESITSFQVQRLANRQQRKRPRWILAKETLRSRSQAPSAWC